MPPPVKDQLVAITGAASGIGRATAELLASSGALLSLADVNGEAVQRVAETLTADGASVLWKKVDVRDAEETDKWVRETVEHFGRKLDGKIDHFVAWEDGGLTSRRRRKPRRLIRAPQQGPGLRTQSLRVGLRRQCQGHLELHVRRAAQHAHKERGSRRRFHSERSVRGRHHWETPHCHLRRQQVCSHWYHKGCCERRRGVRHPHQCYCSGYG